MNRLNPWISTYLIVDSAHSGPKEVDFIEFLKGLPGNSTKYGHWS